MKYNLRPHKNNFILNANSILNYHKCSVINVKSNLFSKISFSTKSDEQHANSIKINLESRIKNNKNQFFFSNNKYTDINSQPKRNLGVFGYNRGKLFVSIKKDPTSFIVNTLIISVFLYSVYTLAPNETISQRRKRMIRDRLMKEYEISENDLEMIDGFDEIIKK